MKHLPYARFLSLVEEFNSDVPKLERSMPLLAYVGARQLQRKGTILTDLVKHLTFGTGPTVMTKVSQLIKRGYLRSEETLDDGRTKQLIVTESGFEVLNKYEALMKEALGA